MKAVILAAAILTASLAWAHDEPCPMPPRLTCDQLLEKAKQRDCLANLCPETEAAAPVAAPCTPVPCSASPCSPVPCAPVDCIPVVLEKVSVVEMEPVPRGNWFAGLGPIWLNNWGATAVMGYKWGNGWALQGGPVWIPQHGTSGSVTSCKVYRDDYDKFSGGYGDNECRYPRTTGFHVESKQPWGGQLVLTYNFK